MRPHIICHMASSIDGRILPSRWRPSGYDVRGPYERLHDEFGGDAWLVGRVTAQEFATGQSYPTYDGPSFVRDSWIAKRGAGSWAIALDGAGRIVWGRDNVGGDPILVILTENVSDAHLAGLRQDGVSYVFSGKNRIDLAQAMTILRTELGIERLLVEGGGVVNGSLLRAGLIDEISLIVAPVIDGAEGAPSVFHGDDNAGPAATRHITLIESRTLENGAVWLRYRVENS
jgi:riboflavin biosynthesis pyrimidine reductase